MKGAVSKVASKIQSNNTLARAVQNGRPLLSTSGRVHYHTFAAPRPRMQPAAPSLDFFHTALLNNFNAVAQPATEFIPRAKLPREIVWLLGAPGAGKGTNSTHVANSFNIQSPTIVMSSLLENGECQRIKDAGGMVDDATVFKALMEELCKPMYRDGAVVDGFPRTKKQAEWLRSMHESLCETGSLPPPTFTFVMLSLSEHTSVARQLSRGNTIRELNALRERSGLDALEVRVTDVSDAAARARYRVYSEQEDAVSQLSSQFRRVVVDADASIESVRARLTTALKPTPFSLSSSSPKEERLFTSSLFSSLGRLAFA